ncbi:MAG: hypothetical protein OXC82_09630 [Rhodobacteraceae bacterium]|nr:hypothetical protein [Paracoccaceae bacterium]MCY4250676.1 hypothetical protein [Paracoccaceae bacterium]
MDISEFGIIQVSACKIRIRDCYTLEFGTGKARILKTGVFQDCAFFITFSIESCPVQIWTGKIDILEFRSPKRTFSVIAFDKSTSSNSAQFSENSGQPNSALEPNFAPERFESSILIPPRSASSRNSAPDKSELLIVASVGNVELNSHFLGQQNQT